MHLEFYDIQLLTSLLKQQNAISLIFTWVLDQLFKMVSIMIQITKPVKFQMMIWLQSKLK